MAPQKAKDVESGTDFSRAQGIGFFAPAAPRDDRGYHAEVPRLNRYQLSAGGPRLERGYEVAYVDAATEESSAADEWRHIVPALSRCQALFNTILIDHWWGHWNPHGSVVSFKCRQVCRRASVVRSVDELNLTKKIISCHPSSLSLPDHVDCFVALNRSPSCLEFSETLLGVHSTFDGSMILFQNVVQVLHRSVSTPVA
jgi:hypothetical protein